MEALARRVRESGPNPPILFGTGLLAKDDLGRLDWSTLGLIAGGIFLGKLIEHSGIFEQLALQVEWSQYSRSALLGALGCVVVTLTGGAVLGLFGLP